MLLFYYACIFLSLPSQAMESCAGEVNQLVAKKKVVTPTEILEAQLRKVIKVRAQFTSEDTKIQAAVESDLLARLPDVMAQATSEKFNLELERDSRKRRLPQARRLLALTRWEQDKIASETVKLLGLARGWRTSPLLSDGYRHAFGNFGSPLKEDAVIIIGLATSEVWISKLPLQLPRFNSPKHRKNWIRFVQREAVKRVLISQWRDLNKPESGGTVTSTMRAIHLRNQIKKQFGINLTDRELDILLRFRGFAPNRREQALSTIFAPPRIAPSLSTHSPRLEYLSKSDEQKGHDRAESRGEQSIQDFRSESDASSLTQIIQTLPLNQRELVLLLYGQGMTISQIAALSGKPEGTIKSRLNKVLVALRAKLKPTLE